MISPVKLLICDDHEVVRAGLHQLLDAQVGFEIVGEAASAEQAVAEAARLQPDLIVMDLAMPGLGGLAAIPQLGEAAPQAKVIVLTVHESAAYLFRALKAGASGYILKGAPAREFIAGLRLAAAGGMPMPRRLEQRLVADVVTRFGAVDATAELTDRERQILGLLAAGKTNKQMAEALYLSVRTVERISSSVMSKLGLSNRAQVVAYAMRLGLLDEAAD